MTKISFLAANPSDISTSRLDEKIRTIGEKLELAESEDLFDLKVHRAANVDVLKDYLRRYKPDIAHFIGHGSESIGITLRDETGGTLVIQEDSLNALFSVLKNSVRCVVLDGCYWEPQAQVIANHIDCVVGVPDGLSDQEATSFAASFYDAIGFGESIKIAFDMGCSQIGFTKLDENSRPTFLALNFDLEENVFAYSGNAMGLARNLVDGDDGLRLEIARNLSETREESLTFLLIERSTADPNPFVRYWLNRALGKIHSAKALETLQRNRKGSDPFASVGAQDALQELRQELGN